MATHGRPVLRDLFDESPTPLIAHPPDTHHRDFYIATDGSFHDDRGGLGVVIETRDGRRVDRLSMTDGSPDNNVAEYRALHLGLDVLAARTPPETSIGILVDHDELAANVNAAILATRRPDNEPPRPLSVPAATTYHWRGIRARIAGFETVRAARIASDHNPAHPLANAPEEYAHVNDDTERCFLPTTSLTDTPAGVPPPSRASRHQASD